MPRFTRISEKRIWSADLHSSNTNPEEERAQRNVTNLQNAFFYSFTLPLCPF
jgi:hypothetical protein